MNEQTYGGIYGALTLPRRHLIGLFYATYPNPHLLINQPQNWLEYPDLTGISDDKASFGVVDNVDQLYATSMWNNLQMSNKRYCVLGITAAMHNIYTLDIVPADYGPYYGTMANREILKSKISASRNYSFFLYSVFQYTGS